MDSVLGCFNIRHSVRASMILRNSVLCIALAAAGFLAGYMAKPMNGIQVTAGQLINCGEVTIPTVEM
jgi:hypothetical protein